ncbi:Ectonucleotide pyrophosphatase/phosphodiesterase member 6 [Chamberlinius hualienensis]
MNKLLFMWPLLVISIVLVPKSSGNVASTSNKKSQNKFLLILFDGFRWDYFKDFTNLPNFDRFRKGGVHADHMEPNFPSLSYPGYYSVLTGRYVESHGFIENTMYDKFHDMYFWTDVDNNGSMSFWWNYTEPLWTTSVKSGLKTFVYHWPGCHVEISGVLPTFFLKYDFYNSTDEFELNIEDILQKFASDDADVGIIYTEYTDMIGHHYGPESIELQYALKDLDNAIGLLLDRLKELNLTDNVNIILVSDHGMTDVSQAKKIQLDSLIDMNDIVHLLGYGSATSIKPVDGKLETVYNALKKSSDIEVYKAEEIPEELHYKHHYRVSPLLVITKPDVFIDPLLNNFKQVPPVTSPKYYNGYHGYRPSDSKDMGAIFLAHGPDFQTNQSAPPIHMVDPYNLMTHLINIQGLPNNGTWNNVKNMLSDNMRQSGLSGTSGAPFSNKLLSSCFIISMCEMITLILILIMP